MKYIKIKIVEYRDPQAYADLQQAATELSSLSASVDAVMRLANELDELAKQSQLPADLGLAASESANSKALASSLIAARMKVKHASEANSRKAFGHPKVGTFGYQEIDSSTMKVLAIKDDQGNPFPAGDVFGYEVADADPPMPAWGQPDQI